MVTIGVDGTQAHLFLRLLQQLDRTNTMPAEPVIAIVRTLHLHDGRGGVLISGPQMWMPIQLIQAEVPAISLPDLAADRVLLLVQAGLLRLGDVAAVGVGHGALFESSLANLAVQRTRLCSGEFAFTALVHDAVIEALGAIEHLITARMGLLPAGFGLSRRAHEQAAENEGSQQSVTTQIARGDHDGVPLLGGDIRTMLLHAVMALTAQPLALATAVRTHMFGNATG